MFCLYQVYLLNRELTVSRRGNTVMHPYDGDERFEIFWKFLCKSVVEHEVTEEDSQQSLQSLQSTAEYTDRCIHPYLVLV